MAGPVEVTFPDGTIYTSGGPEPGKKHMDDGGYDPHFMELVQQVLALVVPLIGAGVISTSNVTVGPGAKTFAYAGDWLPTADTVVVARRAADASVYMIGPATASEAGSVTIDAQLTGGAGTFADWILTPAAGEGVTRLIDDPAPQLGADLNCGGFSISNFGVIAQNAGGIATLRRLRVAEGDQWLRSDRGAVTADQTIDSVSAPIDALTLGANLSITVAVPSAGYAYWRYLIITQDAAGGRVPTFAGPGGYTVQWPRGDEPDWASQDPDTETIVIARAGFRPNIIDLFVGD